MEVAVGESNVIALLMVSKKVWRRAMSIEARWVEKAREGRGSRAEGMRMTPLAASLWRPVPQPLPGATAPLLTARRHTCCPAGHHPPRLCSELAPIVSCTLTRPVHPTPELSPLACHLATKDIVSPVYQIASSLFQRHPREPTTTPTGSLPSVTRRRLLHLDCLERFLRCTQTID